MLCGCLPGNNWRKRCGHCCGSLGQTTDIFTVHTECKRWRKSCDDWTCTGWCYRGDRYQSFGPSKGGYLSMGVIRLLVHFWSMSWRTFSLKPTHLCQCIYAITSTDLVHVSMFLFWNALSRQPNFTSKI